MQYLRAYVSILEMTKKKSAGSALAKERWKKIGPEERRKIMTEVRRKGLKRKKSPTSDIASS